MKSVTRQPYATLILIAICIGVAFVTAVRGGVVENYGFSVEFPSILTAFTSLFVHANVIHLMGNMVFLAAVGVAVEIASGSGRFTLVFLASGIAGVLVYWLAARSSTAAIPLVGASGAIAGCATYYTLRYTNLRVPLAPKKSATVAVVTIGWLILQVIGAFVSIGQPIHGSSFFAHLGGAMCGMLLGIFFRAPDLGDRKLGHQVLEQLNDRGPHATIEHAKRHLSDHPDDVTMSIRLAESYEEVGEFENEAQAYKQVLFKLDPAPQALAIGRLIALNQLSSLPTIKRRQLADRHRNDLGTALLNSIIEASPSDSQRPDAIHDLAIMLRESAPTRSVELFEQLNREYPGHPVTELASKHGKL